MLFVCLLVYLFPLSFFLCLLFLVERAECGNLTCMELVFQQERMNIFCKRAAENAMLLCLCSAPQLTCFLRFVSGLVLPWRMRVPSSQIVQSSGSFEGQKVYIRAHSGVSVEEYAWDGLRSRWAKTATLSVECFSLVCPLDRSLDILPKRLQRIGGGGGESERRTVADPVKCWICAASNSVLEKRNR